MEVGTHSALHRRLATGYGETEGNRHGVDEFLAIIDDTNWSEECWANRGLRDSLAERNIYDADIELIEIGTDVFGRFECSGSGENVGCYAHPDGWVAVVTFTVLDRLDRWDRVVVELVFVRIIFVYLDLTILLVEPRESNIVDSGDHDLLRVEELNNFVPDLFLHAILSKRMIVRDGKQAHESPTFFRASRLLVDIRRIPVDKLRSATIFTYTSIVLMGFDLARMHLEGSYGEL